MCLYWSYFKTSHKIQIYMLFWSAVAMKCFQERYAVILDIKLISSMSKIQKTSKKKKTLFFAIQTLNDFFKKKQNNCFRQSFHMDHENVTNTATLPQAFVKNWGLTKETTGVCQNLWLIPKPHILHAYSIR